MTNASSVLVIPGYQISSQLYAGSRTRVYRAIRGLESLAVVVKLLTSEYPGFNELLQFRNQYTISKNLNIPGIIRPLSLETYGNGYLLVMEDRGEISLREYTKTTTLSLVEFLEIAIQLTNILHALRQNCVIHKDIKPANILIHPETKEVNLIDFSIASVLPKETQEIKNPNVLEGTLAYISPEQTGRMNRGIDYRSDFYSLGVTFYELLIGELPFTSEDPMELVHCHIAKKPTALGNRFGGTGSRENIPEVLSDIVIKLMAKNAEERYQSALGLKYDLDNCLYQLKETGKIIDFEIAQKDICDRFLIPEKLYGRETEVVTLLEAFERVTNGNSEMMLVAGFSGIGKTAVINEVHKPIVRQRGYFIKGKFDQFNRNIPLSAFVQAFRDLMAQLLSESDVQLAAWKTKILAAVGENGQVIVEVIPELERIIGKQPPIPELSGSAAQNRFNLLFQKFIQLFTTKEHPLVMFLDDLQWADSASLNLLQLLMSEAGGGYLLILGAYRDNEVFAAHPLMLTLEQIQKAEAPVNTIFLEPLREITVNQLVADTLTCNEELAQPLTKLVYQKTKGNPFFTTQFLKALYEDGWIEFQSELGSWQCDIAAVQQLALTDDVVDFMALQLQKLSVETQAVLKLAACIGNQFDLITLAIISEQSPVETATNLWKALQEGLILPQSQVYKFYLSRDESDRNTKNIENVGYRFLHDRVQQAAYSLIPDNQKQATHLKIGELLLQKIPATKREEKIFDIVNQLNYGVELITESAEREKLATLNLSAGSKARFSNAYNAATEYATDGIKLLKADCWHSQYQLALELHNLAAEAAYLAGNFELMAEFIQKVLDSVENPFDKIKVYEIQIQAYGAQNQPLAAVKLGQEILKLLGIELPENISNSDIQAQLNQTQSLFAEQSIEDLINLPVMTDKTALAAMKILSNITTFVFQAVPELYVFVPSTQVSLSVKYGNSEQSAFGYIGYGIILSGLVEDIDSSYRFGQLALDVLSQFDTKEMTSKVINGFDCLIRHWKKHTQETVQSLWQCYSVGLETGDLEFAGMSLRYYDTHLYFLGRELKALATEMATHTQAFQQMKQYRFVQHNQIQMQRALNLLGEVDDVLCLKGEACDEETLLPLIMNDGFALIEFYFTKLQLSYLFGKYELAHEYAAQVDRYASGGRSFVISRQCNFYKSLVKLAIFLNVSQDTQTQLLNQVTDNQEKMQLWAQHCPMNVLHQYYLVEAEKYRVLGQNYEAGDFYDRAIGKAKENGYIQEEALAKELAAKFYLNWGKEKIASAYMQEAYYCYARWGAKAKTDYLEKCYPKLLKPILLQQRINLNPWETIGNISVAQTISSTITSTTASHTISDALDFSSLLKAAQTISSRIELDQLVTCLTKIILENSGAKKSALVLPENATWQVKAITSINHQQNSPLPTQTILDSQSIDTCEDIPRKIINYVKNTQETIVIDNCQTDIPGLIGEYMIEHQPQSILCMPITNQGHLVAILYLENKLISGVFTQERLQVINLLSSQAAISLENAQLYQQAQQALEDLKNAQLKIVQSEKMSALGNLVAGVAHEMNNPLGFISATLEQSKPALADIVEHLGLYQENLSEPGEEIIEHAEEIDLDYSLEDLPKMIDSMVMACDRLKNISTSLRTFSRADKDYKVKFNIHDGLDSTILILKHRLKANDKRPAIEVIADYGEISQIECFPGQLNQVFMNLLANAIDALDESNDGRSYEDIKANPNKIIIKTLTENEQIKILISDNGKGMSQEVKTQIFDHLFTTKGVGKGTGLGLAIAKQIVEEKHEGCLEVESELGKGTSFYIKLPIIS
ncbi:putative ATPase [Rivularia sp. PCC 7116]|uniref:ATP-binding sensor histidine kinase n=1 Tax=Rivularia sp. PCC 7116 TaxID=373994 RepID=UPI00029F1723|nr:ATP-binding sensor histidine kinase [Rivularia sp. PCC 7116]AFY57595.1 putative ATPase [Rivularia sp. PCC 7116]